VVALVSTLAGCSSGSDTTLESHDVSVGVLSSAIGCGPFDLAVTRNLFNGRGLDVTVHSVSSEQSLVSGLASGTYNIACGAYPGFFEADNLGMLRLHVVAEAYLASSDSLALIGENSQSALVNPAHLSGKTIAVDSNDPTGELALSEELGTANLAIEGAGAASNGTVKVVPMAASKMAQALSSGQVQAAVMSEPQITEAEQSGLRELIDLGSGPNAELPLDGYFSSTPFALDNPNTLAVFTKVIDQAQSLAANRSLLEPILEHQISGLKPEVAAVMTVGEFPTTVSPARLEQLASLMVDGGELQSNIEVTNLTQGALNVAGSAT
jgi:NitT/TauT family transport system substrate-binding protein